MTTKTPTFTGPRIHVQGSQNILNKNPNVFRLLKNDVSFMFQDFIEPQRN
jgi:hypothetical protein